MALIPDPDDRNDFLKDAAKRYSGMADRIAGFAIVTMFGYMIDISGDGEDSLLSCRSNSESQPFCVQVSIILIVSFLIVYYCCLVICFRREVGLLEKIRYPGTDIKEETIKSVRLFFLGRSGAILVVQLRHLSPMTFESKQ